MPPKNAVLVMYVVLRRDLLTELKWPIGALVAQACHASTAVLWTHKDDSSTVDYMANMGSMRKVLLEVKNEQELKSISDTLISQKIDHNLWIEQPENIATCIALKPYPRNDVQPFLKHLSLFS
uniref:peptidyl-tRNA hydrolase n=1 Tax=Romanomermis culicivorax TaxID=13658 RepID=A0A915IHP7_ROMCU